MGSKHYAIVLFNYICRQSHIKTDQCNSLWNSSQCWGCTLLGLGWSVPVVSALWPLPSSDRPSHSLCPRCPTTWYPIGPITVLWPSSPSWILGSHWASVEHYPVFVLEYSRCRTAIMEALEASLYCNRKTIHNLHLVITKYVHGHACNTDLVLRLFWAHKDIQVIGHITSSSIGMVWFWLSVGILESTHCPVFARYTSTPGFISCTTNEDSYLTRQLSYVERNRRYVICTASNDSYGGGLGTRLNTALLLVNWARKKQ